MYSDTLLTSASLEFKYNLPPDLCIFWRNPIPCAGNRNEPVLRWIKSWIKSVILKRIWITQIRRIFTDFFIRVYPCHPCNPCSATVSLFVEAPQIRNVIYHRFAQTINLRSSAFICGSFFAGAPDNKDSDRINRMDRIKPSTNPINPIYPVHSGPSFSTAPDINQYESIKIKTSQNFRTQNHPIPPSLLKFPGALLEKRPSWYPSAGNEPMLCWFRYKESFNAELVRRLTAFTENIPKMQE